MKHIIILLLFVASFSALQSQTDSPVNPENTEYLEWVGQNGFRFMTEFKVGETTIEGSEVLDANGNPIPLDVTEESFNITDYDFNTIVAPEKSIIIRISDDKAIFINSRYRQSVLFERYLINSKKK